MTVHYMRKRRGCRVYFPHIIFPRSLTSWGRCEPDALENRGWTNKSREHNHHQTVTFSLIHSLDRSKLPSDCVSCPPSFSVQFLFPLKFCPKFMSKWPVLKLRKQTTQTQQCVLRFCYKHVEMCLIAWTDLRISCAVSRNQLLNSLALYSLSCHGN